MKCLLKTALLLFGLLFFSLSAATASQVKLKAEPGQLVMLADKEGRTYLRVSLEGLPFDEEGARAPVNVSLVIDKSGSMQGPKMEQAKEAAIMALSRLAKQDMISVVAFNHMVNVLVRGGPYENTDEMRRRIESLRADGQTAIYAGVQQGAEELREFLNPHRVNRIVLLSDGLANVGPSSPEALGQLGRELGAKGISVTTIGLGLGYNEDLMAKLALASDGNHAFVEHPEQLVEIFNKEFGDVLSVVAQEVEIIIICPDGVKPMRALGRDVQIDGQRVSFKLNQIYSKQEKYLILELDVAKSVARDQAGLAKVEAVYTDMKTKQRVKLDSAAGVRFSPSPEEAERSLDKGVMAAVATQVATERNEKAVSLRDSGKLEEAKRELEQNANYLREQGERLNSPKLKALSKKNDDDASAATAPGAAWDKQRKEMRFRQHQDKSQQSY